MKISVHGRGIGLVVILAITLLAGASARRSPHHIVRSGAPWGGEALTTARVDHRDIVPGTATVTFQVTLDPTVARERIASIGATVLDTVPKLATYEVSLPAGMTVDTGLLALSKLPGALRSEPAVQLHADNHPNDPLYNRYQTPYLGLLHAEQAWDMQLGNPGVVVAVLDSGVDVTHPDLRDQIWTNPNPGQAGCGNDVHGCNFVDPRRVDPSCGNQNTTASPNGDVMPYPGGELNYHGTFVAGIIAAGINNGTGIAGIAPHATIMPVRVGDCTRPLDTAVANGLLYAADHGAAVINLSLGGGCSPWPSFIIDAINHAEARGAVIVAAAGNEHRSCVDSPANVPGVIAVSSTDATGLGRASFTSWGPQVVVSAPGVNIVGTVPHRDEPPPNDLYSVDDGTSFSAPIVSGLAALLLSQNPALTPDWVRYLIQAGATPLADPGQTGWSGAGRVDLAGSLSRVPGAISGSASRGGAPVPDGTPVQAYIGSSLCGEGSTYASSAGSSFFVFVTAASDQPGCGSNGATVTLVVNGVPAATTPFTPTSVSLDLAAQN